MHDGLVSSVECHLLFLFPSSRLGGKMWNFKLYYEDKLHYVGE